VKIMGIETSCDDTTVGIIDSDRIIANEIESQHEFHADFGGVVPEIASRQHLVAIGRVVDHALSSAGIPLEAIDAFAVTAKPGLLGALLVGLSYAKGLAFSLGKPLVPVDHIVAHASAALLGASFSLPAVALIVSGGHTSLYSMRSRVEFELLGETIDDAAGEVFDKISRHMGLGWPGGPVIDELAHQAKEKKIRFTSPLAREESSRFSFSGLKTAATLFIDRNPNEAKEEIAYGLSRAIVGVLVKKSVEAVRLAKAKTLVVAGGVAANSMLRAELADALSRVSGEVSLLLPTKNLCTDNGVMVAAMAKFMIERRGLEAFMPPTYFEMDAEAS
jgi:N6-L-threonylcarbamoyladenine synthase